MLPSDVPGLRLDSVSWRVHTGHENQEFGTWTSLGFTGMIESDTVVSLVGVGVEFIGRRGSTTTFRDTVSSFYAVRPEATVAGASTVIILERVRPARPVHVGHESVTLGSQPAEGWGCPTAVRIVRLPAGTYRRSAEAPVPEDERPSSRFYPWDPFTFDLDSAVTSLPMVFALIDGTHADTVQSELVVGHTQILFRERIGGVFLADTSRLSIVDYQLVMRARARSGQALLDRIHEDVRPSAGQTTLFMRTGPASHTWRYPIGAPPPAAAPLDSVLRAIRAHERERALRVQPAR